MWVEVFGWWGQVGLLEVVIVRVAREVPCEMSNTMLFLEMHVACYYQIRGCLFPLRMLKRDGLPLVAGQDRPFEIAVSSGISPDVVSNQLPTREGLPSPFA